MWVHLSDAAREAMSDAIVALIDAGSSGDGQVKLYGDTPAVDAETAVGSQTLISTHNFSDPAFGAAVDGVVTADPIDNDTSAAASDDATWARVTDSDGVVIMDWDAGESGTTLILDESTITIGDTVAITSAVMTMPDGT